MIAHLICKYIDTHFMQKHLSIYFMIPFPEMLYIDVRTAAHSERFSQGVHMHAQAQSIISSLTTAFGGASQYGEAIVGAAIFGRANNAPSPWKADEVRDLIDAAAALIAEYWDEEVDAITSEILFGYRGAREEVQGTDAPEI